MARRRALLAAAALAAGGVCAGRVAAATGFAAHNLEWRDPQRQRAVPVRLYWPQQASGEVPLVLFSHGFGGERGHATWLGHTLAAAGMACAHLQHIGSDYRMWLSGPLEWVLREFQGEGMARERLARVDDMRFVLDRLLAGEWGSRIDRGRIAAVGHSLGAQTALLLGGARLPRQGSLRDERFGAAVAIGTAAFPGVDAARIVEPVVVPTLHITTEEDKTSIPGYAAGVEERVAWYRACGGGAKVLVVYRQGRHALFNDATPEDPVAASASGAVQAFLRSLWQADGRALPAWRESQASLLSRFETQGELQRQPFGVRT